MSKTDTPHVEMTPPDAIARHYVNPNRKLFTWSPQEPVTLRPDVQPREMRDNAADAIAVQLRRRAKERKSG